MPMGLWQYHSLAQKTILIRSTSYLKCSALDLHFIPALAFDHLTQILLGQVVKLNFFTDLSTK